MLYNLFIVNQSKISVSTPVQPRPCRRSSSSSLRSLDDDDNENSECLMAIDELLQWQTSPIPARQQTALGVPLRLAATYFRLSQCRLDKRSF